MFPKVSNKLWTFWSTCETEIMGKLAYSGILSAKLLSLKLVKRNLEIGYWVLDHEVNGDHYHTTILVKDLNSAV